VLVYISGHPFDRAGRERRWAFVSESLGVTGALVRITSNPLEFAALMRAGTFNTYVILTKNPILLPLLADELREAAHRGDGLVLAQWGGGTSMGLEPALGGRIKGGLPGHGHTLSLMDSPLGPAQTLSIPGRAARLKLSGADVAGTLERGAAGVSFHEFGAGDGILLAFDPAVPSNHPDRDAFEALFAAAVTYAAPDVPREPRAGIVVPLAFVLENPRDMEIDVEIVLELPLGIVAAAVDDGPTTDDPPIWNLTLLPQSSTRVRFATELPDDASHHVIYSTIKVEGIAMSDPPSLILDVAAPVAERLAAAIISLEETQVSGRDRGRLRAALGKLRDAQLLSTGPHRMERQIRLAANAAGFLGDIQGADVSVPRNEVDWIIAAWERAWSSWRWRKDLEE
jgi:hypothetical protein